MEPAVLWYVILGALFFVMAVSSSFVRGLPLNTALIYLVIGFGLGPFGVGLLDIDILKDSEWLERVTEIVVIVSLFAAGLKLRLPFRDANWFSSLRLATLSMWITVAMIAAASHWLLGLPVGHSVLLGAILAPTDPVLASEVQVAGPHDRDKLRFSLTGEAGLNDGTAFPFVMLGLGLIGLHELGERGTKWILVDLVWATGSGLLVGAVLGTLAARFATWLRCRHRETTVLDDFLAIGLIAFSYGLALAIHGYGFLSVFAAGVALRRFERVQSGMEDPRMPDRANDVQPEQVPAHLAQAALTFDEQLERIGEVTTVLLVGSMILTYSPAAKDLWLLPLVFLVIRPASVWIGLWRSQTSGSQLHYISWFGIRGIGSLYYLTYAIGHGLTREMAERITAITVSVVAASILLHGISVTPLMTKYSRQRG